MGTDKVAPGDPLLTFWPRPGCHFSQKENQGRHSTWTVDLEMEKAWLDGEKRCWLDLPL